MRSRKCVTVGLRPTYEAFEFDLSYLLPTAAAEAVFL